MYPSPSELERYWARLLPDFQAHWLRRCPERWANSIPIVLWGDEGTLNNSSWMVVSWQRFRKRQYVVVCSKTHKDPFRVLGAVSLAQDSGPQHLSGRCQQMQQVYDLLIAGQSLFIRDHINESLNQLNTAVVDDLNNPMSSGIAKSSGVPLW